MKTALKKINKFILPLNEEQVTKYAARLEQYWNGSEDIIKQKYSNIYEKI
ncbi:MAG TPA: hypothetical protein VF839_01365 [Clostridium sp.]